MKNQPGSDCPNGNTGSADQIAQTNKKRDRSGADDHTIEIFLYG